MGLPPPEHSPIDTGAHHAPVVGGDLDAGDAAAVADAYVGHLALLSSPTLSPTSRLHLKWASRDTYILFISMEKPSNIDPTAC